MQSELDKIAENIVRNEVRLCVSSLVSTLAGAAYRTSLKTNRELDDLCEQAAELCAPIDDYEESATQAGWTRQPDGRWWRNPQEGDDLDNAEMFLGSGPFVYADSAQGACEIDNLEPYQWEVYEHWVVSKWLGHDLEELGERVDHDFASLVVWARTTTGQSIAADSVMLKVAKLVQDRAAGIITPATAARRGAEFATFMAR